MINPYQSRAALFGQMQTRQAAQADSASAPRAAASLRRAQPPARVAPQEAARIEQAFPPQPALSMKLYGPGSAAHTVAPASLGGRLDLSA